MDWHWGWQFRLILKKWQGLLFVSDNSRKDIVDNWSDRLEKSDLIQKIKQLETFTKMCAWLLLNSFYVIYAILLLHTHKCQHPVGVIGSQTSMVISVRVWSFCLDRYHHTHIYKRTIFFPIFSVLVGTSNLKKIKIRGIKVLYYTYLKKQPPSP